MRITKADMIWEEDLKALQEAQQEAHAARQSMGACGWRLRLCRALQAQARCALNLNDAPHAQMLIEEAFSCLPDETLPHSSADFVIARNFIVRARCSLERAAFESAEQDLEEAWRLILSGQENSAGRWTHSAIVFWWETMALWRMAQNNFEGALEAWQQAVQECRKRLPNLGAPERKRDARALAELLEGLGQAQQATGDHAAAQKAIAEAASIKNAIGFALTPRHSGS